MIAGLEQALRPHPIDCRRRKEKPGAVSRPGAIHEFQFRE